MIAISSGNVAAIDRLFQPFGFSFYFALVPMLSEAFDYYCIKFLVCPVLYALINSFLMAILLRHCFIDIEF